ncbi:MAG: hypothetical protein N3C63_09175 [Rhodocyclaceae bacterium]|nr:hypothetical protein [Rhodocyclaceae bacterium]
MSQESVQPVAPLENEVVSQPAPAPQPPFDPRRRIRELLAIPERDRTDAEWDELNELEIQTAPGNRISGQPFANYGGGGKPAPGSKNRFKKQRKGARGAQAKANHKPRPA